MLLHDNCGEHVLYLLGLLQHLDFTTASLLLQGSASVQQFLVSLLKLFVVIVCDQNEFLQVSVLKPQGLYLVLKDFTSIFLQHMSIA